MLAFLAVVALGIVVGLARGGSFRNLTPANLRASPALFGAVALQAGAQFIPERRSEIAFALVVASFGAVFGWAAANWRARGMALVAIGALLNFIVIAANQGMPVSADAARRAGYRGPIETVVERGKHIVATDGTRLRGLGDVIPIAGDRSVLSVGDLVLYAGLVLLIQGLLVGRGARLGSGPKSASLARSRSP